MSIPGLLYFDALDKKLLAEALRKVFERDCRAPAVYLLCTHEWGNIGDLAINYNEVALLERLFPERQLFVLSRSALAANWQRIRSTVQRHDLIVIHGGGNMGDIWPHEEAARLTIVKSFPENSMISMPQSIHFDNEDALSRSMREYSRHKKLLMILRDDRSYELAGTHLGKKKLVRGEDIVTRQEYAFPFRQRTPHVLAFARNDLEKRPGAKLEKFLEHLEMAGNVVERSDTTVQSLPFSNTELAAKLVYQKIDEAHAASLVVTDRLHGALFALIAGRPVIIFENSYGKISRALATLASKMVGYVHFAEEMNGLENVSAIRDFARGLMLLPDFPTSPATLVAEQNASLDQILLDFVAAG